MARLPALIVLLAALAFAASPLLTGGFSGFDPARFPVPQFDPPIQPVGFSFAIWGVIYLWLIGGSAYGLIYRPADPGWQAMRTPLTISLGIGVFWIPVAQSSPRWAFVLIVLMTLTALAAWLRAGRSDPVWQRWPIGLYAGWLTAATGVSLGILLAGYGIMGATPAAVLALLVILVVALAVQFLRPEALAYPAAILWASCGIVAANLMPPNLPVLLVTCVVIAALAIRVIIFRKPM